MTAFTVTATATDPAGNTDVCTFDITVTDNEDPVITCPADIAVNTDAGDCEAVVTFSASATDNCSAVITYSHNSGDAFPVGTTTVTATRPSVIGLAQPQARDAEAVAAKGYAATSVADIIERAGVSRTTFYQLFDDKLDCFLAACRMASDVVVSVLADELARIEAEGVTTPVDKLDRLLGAYLQTLAEFPVLARVFLVEVYAAGTPAIQQRRDSLEQFVDLIAAARRGQPGLLGDAGQDERFAAEVLVGAVSSMVTNAVGVGETDDLPALHAPLMRLAARILDTR